KKGNEFGRSILILGEHARSEELDAKKRTRPLILPKKNPITFPVTLPSFILNQYTVKAFNFLYYAKNTRKELNNIVSYEPFFYLSLMNWMNWYLNTKGGCICPRTRE